MLPKLKFDGEIDVATYESRKSTSCKRCETKWSKLLGTISEPERSKETFTEYAAMSKPKQDNLKDVGGYVGGLMSGGNRKKTNLIHRQLITLDIDHAGKDDDTWEQFKLIYGKAAAIHSTRKHCGNNPRLRLLVPLSEPVGADEYAAVARGIAKTLGFNKFDETTFEPSRLMYFPSVCADGEWLFKYHDAEWLDPKEVLSRYGDWKNVAEHPVGERAETLLRREIAKQENPLEKSGVVGAFCRTFDIRETIEKFLSDVYEPCAIDDRYTYRNASTYAGLKIYDDMFAYSHHESDPASRKLCNAFDLVRVHKFGNLDEATSEKTNAAKRPSFIRMTEFATKIKEVKRLIADEKMKGAKNDFSEVESPESEDWKGELDVNRKGEILANASNLELITANDPALKELFATDTFARRMTLTRKPFWERDEANLYVTDTDAANLRLYLEKTYGIKAKGLIDDVLLSVSAKNGFHPVKNYLDELKWDGTGRVETLFMDFLGVGDSSDGYERDVSKLMLASAVKRIYEPGCAMDYVAAFVGEEGIGKSKLLAKLAKNPAWFADSFSVEGKEAYENLRGKWIIEIAELVALKKSDSSVVKNFLSKTSDFYRAAYERFPRDYPRQCVFFGSGNEINFLKGEGGDRRFFPLPVSGILKKRNWNALGDDEIDQIWAEAKTLYLDGKIEGLIEKLDAPGKRRQTEHMEIDVWEEQIDEFLSKPLPENWKDTPFSDFNVEIGGTTQRDCVTTREIWECCFRERKPIDYQSQKRITKIMERKKDWDKSRFRYGGGTSNPLRGWKKHDAKE